MAWLFLTAAGACEIVATTLFRYTEGLSRLWPTLGFIAVGLVSLYLLQRSISGGEAIPLGTAYAVWTGIGAAGTVLIGVIFYGEPAGALRLGLLALLVSSIIGLKFASAS